MLNKIGFKKLIIPKFSKIKFNLFCQKANTVKLK